MKLRRAGMHAVFEVDTDCAGFDNGANGLFEAVQIRRVSTLDVGAQWNLEASCDARNQRQHLVARNRFAVRIAQRVGDAGAGGRDGGKTGGLENLRAGDIPRIRNHQDARAIMHLAK